MWLLSGGVRHKDGRERVITADKYGPYGDNHVFESDDGIIAVIERASLRRSHPPKRCPICQGDLSIHVTDHKSTA